MPLLTRADGVRRSTMAEQARSCVICGNNTSVLYALPSNAELRNIWLQVVYGTPPARYSTAMVVCCNHFERRDFSNYGAYSSGFASRLILKPGSVPSRRSTAISQPSASQTLMRPTIHTSTQTDRPSLSCRATQLSMSTLGNHFRSKGTQTEAFMTSTSIATSTLDAPWGPAHSKPIKSKSAKRPWVDDEEEESELCTIPTEPHSSTSEPVQSISSVVESSQITDTSSTGCQDSTYIVFEKNLMELFETCPVCSQVSDVRTFRRGTFLSVIQKCHHCQFSKKWKSQPEIGSSSVDNVQLSAAIQ